MEGQVRFDTVKLATQYWNDDSTLSTMIIIIFILAFVIFILGGFILQRYLKQKNVYKYFVRYAKTKELTDEEIAILWKYVHEMERDPMLVLEFKAPFEKVVDLYIKTDPNASEELVQDMRKKLDFVIQSPYVPLVTTKDIEMFQNGKLILPDNRSYNIALYDKDERYMYWLAVDGGSVEIAPKTNVKIVFIRPDDAIYTLVLPVEEILKETGKTMIKLPHTFDFHRVQRREFPRVHVSFAVTITFEDHEGKEVKLAGSMEDISAGGAHICTADIEKAKLIRYGTVVHLRTKLDDIPLQVDMKVLDNEIKTKIACFRGQFVDIKDATRDVIMDFVQKEMLKLAQLRQK